MIQFEVSDRTAPALRVDCLAIGLFDDDPWNGIAGAVDRQTRGRLRALHSRGDLPGRAGDIAMFHDLPGLAAARLIVVALGARKDFQPRKWRKALAAVVAAVARTGSGSLGFAVERPTAAQLTDYYLGRGVAEVTLQSLYRINDLKSGRRPKPAALKRVLVAAGTKERTEVRRGLAAGEAIAQGQKLMRDLGNLPPNVCTPRYLAQTARALAGEHRSLRTRVLDEAQIRRLKMGCLLAVSRGSAEPPRFIVVEHRGGRRGDAPVVLVGKGVTFDTGGISLKDPAAMDEMKYDMCGAASVLATLKVAALLKLRINLVGLVAAVENMPDGRATRPGDIATSAAGKTVEILNTDAEGRLILCDALHYARRFNPQTVLDIATLTGACVIALGHHHTGVMSRDDELARELVAAGARADDRAWQLPLTDDYAEQLKSNFADLANVAGRDGGAITAGAFLGQFTQGLSWAHLDIAGTAWVSGAQKGATGRPVALLTDFLIQRAGPR
ncbi:MAG: leucyl aminopeptidase [Steroidobacteraceae bacterium]